MVKYLTNYQAIWSHCFVVTSSDLVKNCKNHHDNNSQTVGSIYQSLNFFVIPVRANHSLFSYLYIFSTKETLEVMYPWNVQDFYVPSLYLGNWGNDSGTIFGKFLNYFSIVWRFISILAKSYDVMQIFIGVNGQISGHNAPEWPEKNRQMSIKVVQKWFH